MAPSKKQNCQLILLHYYLQCKSIKKLGLVESWMTFFLRRGFDTTISLQGQSKMLKSGGV